ncbi:MAG: D-alanyl-D-alanine carboxypeptidase family protein [Acidimicrobiales bacterium]
MVVAMLAQVPEVGAAERKNPRAERERVRAQRAQLAGQLDVLTANDQQVRKAVADLEANVGGQQALLADARRGAEQAARDVEMAQAEERQAAQRVGELEARVRTVAVETFMRPPSVDSVTVFTSSRSISEAARKQAMLILGAARELDLLDQLRAARQDVEARRREAEAASTRAEQKKGEIASRLEKLEKAKTQQEGFAAALEQRIESALAESAALEQLDRRLAEQIAQEQARLAAQLRRRGSPRSGGALRVGRVTTVSVRGIQVSPEIADRLEALLAAAEADGIVLRGGGYRDPSAQVALRQAHCGSGDYAVYSMPASECIPPTARPGASMHERGLAVDFTYGGSIITSRSSPAFRWLAANARRYGLYNLPSEPWHWSTNGD